MKNLLATSALGALLAFGGFGVAHAQTQTQEQTNPNAGAKVHVQEPAPRVTVHEHQPNVEVQQPKPNVIVQQPQPNVRVAQPKPEVTVQQPQPKVTVKEPQPNVTVHEAQPNVAVQKQGQPSVSVNRTGHTNVEVVHTNKATETQQGQNQTRERQMGQSQQSTQEQAANAGMPLIAGKKLIGTNVTTANGKNAGQVNNLLIGPKGNVQAAIVEWGGGIFGVGSNQTVVPIKDFQVNGNKAKVNLTESQLQKLPSFDKSSVNKYGTGWHAYQ